MPEKTLPALPDTGPFIEEIRAFNAQDAKKFPAENGVVFVGSSSIALWENAQRDFPFINLIRRGFGGSILEQSTLYAPFIVVPYAPRLVVMYAGDNDLASGKSPEEVRADFQEFVETVRADLPAVLIAFVSIKFSPNRWNLKTEIARANELISEYSRATPDVHFIDLTQTMMSENGAPRPELFSDGLHPNAAGYAAWTGVLAPAIRHILASDSTQPTTDH